MNSFKKTNLQNIRNIFEEKTGVDLSQRQRPHVRLVKIAAPLAAIMILCLGMTVSAFSLFSSLEEDDLAIRAAYEGEGIVSVHVENRSGKELHFEPRLKLMRWASNEEIKPVSDDIAFTGTIFEAHSSGVMTIDLSRAYDLDMLEQPLVDDYYYFVLTNNNFAFGQDWMCSVEFAAPILSPQKEPTPVAPGEADPDLVAEILEELKPYFEIYTLDPHERNRLAREYVAQCQDLLGQIDGTVVAPVSPMEFTMTDSDQQVIFDPEVPLDMQLQLTGLHRRVMDGYDKIIGASETDSALVLSAYIPQKKGDIDGGVDIPLIYVFIYSTEDIHSPKDYAFIRGQLKTFEELEPCKIYEDAQYVCYNATPLFYTDLYTYVESMVSQRSDVYFDGQVWKRVENIYTYYSENIGKLLGYRDTAPADDTPSVP